MKKLLIGTVLGAACLLALAGSHTTRAGAAIGGASTTLTTTLSGFQEPPAIASSASGSFSAVVSDDGSSVDYTLSYSGFETDVIVSHIHLGLPSVNGGVTVFLCGGGGKPDCPAREGTVTGTFTADDVIGLPMQRLAANDLPTLLAGINAGATYVNVHTMDLPGGEIRGQISALPSGGSNKR
jgi:hypothetical protein